MTDGIPIVEPEAVTPRWVTQVLHANDIDAVVSDLDMEPVGTGQMAETRRFNLRFRGTPAPDAPRSVVGKFPSASPVSRTSGRDMHFYRSEVMFYRELASRAGIRTPTVYAAEIDEQRDFVLLFEDLAPARQGDQLRGCTLDQARAALREAALLHAAFWNDTELMAQDWLYVPEGAQGFYTTELMERAWAHFKPTYSHRLQPEVVQVCEEFVRHHAAWNAPRPMPKCYSHNDFRPDNMLFGENGARVAVVDWQTSNFLGSGMDAAYFLGGALPRAVRRAHENELLHQYHDDLLAHGVRGYSFEHLLADYRHYSFAALAVVIAATVIVKQTERGDEMFMRMTTGAAHQALDCGALDVLPS